MNFEHQKIGEAYVYINISEYIAPPSPLETNAEKHFVTLLTIGDNL